MAEAPKPAGRGGPTLAVLPGHDDEPSPGARTRIYDTTLVMRSRRTTARLI
jgi:hypothetical protein